MLHLFRLSQHFMRKIWIHIFCWTCTTKRITYLRSIHLTPIVLNYFDIWCCMGSLSNRFNAHLYNLRASEVWILAAWIMGWHVENTRHNEVYGLMTGLKKHRMRLIGNDSPLLLLYRCYWLLSLAMSCRYFRLSPLLRSLLVQTVPFWHIN